MTNRLHGLDALRGLAALVVFFAHFVSIFGLSLPYGGQARAVDVFFVLSGFVLARTYEARMPTTRRFAMLRYKRLIPCAGIGAMIGLISAIIAGFDPALTLLAYFAVLLFLPSPWLPLPFLINPPMWSLFVEIVMNILHAALLVKCSNRILAALCLIGLAIYLPMLVDNPEAGIPTTPSIIPALGRGLAGYTIGILVWRVWLEKPLNFPPLLALALFPVLAYILQAADPFGGAIFLLVVAPFLVRALLGMRNAKWAGALGALSYPLYVVHYPLFVLLRDIGLHPAPALTGTLALAIAITVFVEGRRERSNVRALPEPAL